MNYYEAAHSDDADPYEQRWVWCITLHLPNSFDAMLVQLADPVAGRTKQLTFPAGSDPKGILSWEVRAYIEGVHPWWNVGSLQPHMLEIDRWHSGTYNELLTHLLRRFHAVR